ncbi:MAG: hypothetical protein Q9197_004421 [Variospora fuerteventurae]
MKHSLQLLSITALSQLAYSAVEPTSSGPIAINVVSIFGRPDPIYPTKVRDFTLYMNEKILLTDTFTQTYTETVEDRPVIQVTPVRIVVATATAAAHGYQVGDVSVLLSDELVADLESLAVTACGGAAKLKSRQTCSPLGAGSFVEAAAGPGGPMNDVFLNGLPKITVTAGDVARALEVMVAAGKITAEAIPVATLAALWLSIYIEEGAKQTLRLPKANTGSGSVTQPPSPTSSSSACPTGANAPLCADQGRCKGVENVCSQGKYKKCDCINQFDILIHPIDEGQLKEQQAFLASVAALPLPTKTQEAWCVWNANPRATPTAWCECANFSSTFAVATGSATAGARVCPYTTAPGDTITVKTTKGGATSTSVAPTEPQPTFSAGEPFCYRGDAPAADITTMREGVEKFCKDIKNDLIQTGFSTGPICSVKLAKDIWMELSVAASYIDENGECKQENMDNLETDPDKCQTAMTNAILCNKGETVNGGGSATSKGGTDVLECVLYGVQTVTRTDAKGC